MHPVNLHKYRYRTAFHLSYLLAVVLFSAAASAATITVTNTSNSGAGSLRQAITDAASGDTINFSVTGTITLTSGQLVIDKNLTIQGPGASLLSISGNHASRVFSINTGITAMLDGITVRDGYAFTGGGIYNDNATLTIVNSAVSNNTGAGIYNYAGHLTIANSIISGNTNGGGIYCVYSCGVLNNSIVSGNTAELYGGGITAFGDTGGEGVSLTINSSTVSGNTGDGLIAAQTSAFVINSTVSGNTGNGINIENGTVNTETLTVNNSTVSGNSDNGINIYGSVAGTLTNTIVASNSGGDMEVSGVIASASHNLIGDAASSGGITNGVNGNIVGVNPLLGPLQNNGGPTATHALLPGSPAINAGNNCVLTPNGCGNGNPALPTDQRGMPRNGTVDIGAFERQISDTVLAPAPFDFDGDGKTDIGIFRPGPAEWWYQRSSDGQVPATQFGATTDKIVPGDFTGDGKADIAVWRPSTGFWYVIRSEDNSFFAFPFGQNGDVPVPADYDADGKFDTAVFRPSTATWFIPQSGGGGTSIFQFGITGDQPTVADYDGDGKADVAIFRPGPGEWWIQRSTAGTLAFQFGAGTDKPVQGDYTGDGKADAAFWRPSNGFWYILRSEDFSFFALPFGQNGDIVAPGDYDGDGKFDLTVFRPAQATWYIQRTTAGTQIVQFGVGGDQPIANAFVP